MLNSCAEIEGSVLDEDIKAELLGKLRMLKCEYELMKTTLVKDAFKLNNERRECCLQSTELESSPDKPKGEFDLKLFPCVGCDNLILDDNLWKTRNSSDADQKDEEHPRRTNNNQQPHNESSFTSLAFSVDESLPSECEDGSVVSTRKLRKAPLKSKSSHRSAASPVLCRKNKFRSKRRNRKFFPKIPIALLRDLTNKEQVEEFTLPDHWLKEAVEEVSDQPSEQMLSSSDICVASINNIDISGDTMTETHLPKDIVISDVISIVSKLEIPESDSIISVVPESPIVADHTVLKIINTSTCNSESNHPCEKILSLGSGAGSEERENEPPQSTIKVIKLTLRFYQSRGFLALSFGDTNTSVHEKLQAKLWTEVWRSQSKISIDELQWLMAENWNSNLLILKVNWEFSKIWVSSYDASTGVGIEDFLRIDIKQLRCVAVLPSLQIAARSNKLVKYWVDLKKRVFKKSLVLMSADDDIVSLCSLSQQPNALLGISASHVYIWNHVTGCLLQQIATSQHMECLLDASSCRGVVTCHVIIKCDGMLSCACICCNPVNGRSVLICKECLDYSSEKCSLTVHVPDIGFVALHDPSEVRSLLENFSSLPDQIEHQTTRCCCKPTMRTAKLL